MDKLSATNQMQISVQNNSSNKLQGGCVLYMCLLSTSSEDIVNYDCEG